MKKFITILNIIIIVLFCISMQASAKNNKSSNWEKLNDYIYLDKSSITQTKYIISAWFKVYSSDEHNLFSVNDIPVYYDLVKYDIDCTDKSISIEHSKSYDIKNNMIEEYTNPHGYGCLMPCLIDDEIYYNALCKYKKDGK